MNMDALKQQLRIHEGLRLKPYLDTVGKTTIGIGRNLDDVGISEAEAYYLLENDIAGVFADLDRSLPWWRTLSERRQMVLADLCFNVGIIRLIGFEKALSAMQAGDYEMAANEMKDSRWYVQVGRRGETLCQMMRNG